MNRTIVSRFFRTVLPSMLAFAFSSLFVMVDGFFVGRNTGDLGLAAINVAFPLVSLILSAGTGVGMGAAVQASIRRGAGDRAGEERFFCGALILLLATGIALTVLVQIFARPLLILFGAAGELLSLSQDYISIVALGALFYVLATGLVPLLRNYDKPLQAMGAMMCGFGANIVLDWLFVEVWKWGVPGAALATAISQFATVLPCLPFLVRKVRTVPRSAWHLTAGVAGDIFRVGLSPFGLTLSPNLVLLVMNRACLAWGGDPAVAAYAVISYAITVVQYLLQGVGDGSQPLISLCLGQGEFRQARAVRNLAYGLAAAVSVFNLWLLWVAREIIPTVFGASPETVETVSRVLIYFSIGALALSFCRVTTSYFYSIRANRFAYVMVYGEPVLLTLLLTACLPWLWGMEGVWLATPTAQFLLAGVGAVLLRKNHGRAPALQPEMS